MARMRVPCPAPHYRSLSLSLEEEREREEKSERGKGWGGWMLPCLAPSALYPACVSLSHPSERKRENETRGQGWGWPCRACLSLYLYVLFILSHREKDAERPRLGWMVVVLPCPLYPLARLRLSFTPL